MQLPDVQRIQHIKEYCDEIADTINRYGNSFGAFDSDMDYQKSVSFSILQIGELVGKLSEEYREKTNHLIHWSSIKGMRNFFAHNYGSMNREVIWKTAIEDIPALEKFCSEQLTEADQEDEEVPTQSM